MFYEISYGNLDTNSPHLVAYEDDYLATAFGTNYLGDPGASAIPGQPPMSFQVKVTAGHSLVLAFSSVGAFGGYEYTVKAYSDANFGENFPVTTSVPEPASLALVGAALLGLGLSRRKAA